MFRAGKEVLPLLDTVLAEPTSLTPAMLMRMQSLQTIIYDNLPIVINQRRGMCLLAIVYSICFCAAGSGGLWLIHLLRQSE